VRQLFSLAGVLLVLMTSSAPAQRTTRILVPTFDGPSHLAANVSTVLALHLWITLRQHPTPNPYKLDFGNGEVAWSTSALAEPSTEFALAAARGTRSQMVLWGFVQEYGPGAIVQSFLTISEDAQSSLRWSIARGNVRVELGLPSGHYEFSPLILPEMTLQKYSRPNQMRICASKQITCNGPYLSKTAFRASRQEGEFAFVHQDKKVEGWVFLPDLSSARGEVQDFTGGMIAFFRNDFEQARRLFERVANSKVGGSMRFNALLLGGIAEVRGGGDVAMLQRALAANPYSRHAAQALAMAHLLLVPKTSENALKRLHVQSAARLTESYQDLFHPDDTWFKGMQEILAQYKDLR
jgi:hypothetical protein